MTEDKNQPRQFQLVGGELCLDFANTVGGTRSGVSREYLPAYRDLLDWGTQAGVLTDREVLKLSREAERQPSAAAAVYRRAIAFREVI